MPSLGVKEEYYTGDDPVSLKISVPKERVFDIQYDPVPFRGVDYKGVVKCEGSVIDAFKAYSICTLEDENGDVLFASGWVVDIDPHDASPVRSYHDAKVKYFITLRKDFARSRDFKVREADVSEEFREVLSIPSGKYAGMIGYVYPIGEYMKEEEQNPELTKRRAELLKKAEERFSEILGE